MPHCCDGNLKGHIVRSANSKKSSRLRLSERHSQRDEGCDPLLESRIRGVLANPVRPISFPKPTASLRIALANIGSSANQSLVVSPSLGINSLFHALWIYIGETENIRVRLLEHLADDGPPRAIGPCL